MSLEVTIAEQLWCCLASLILGVAAGMLYDVFAVFYMSVGIRDKSMDAKRKYPVAVGAVFIFDLLYCALVSVAFAVLMYAFSYGRFRVVFLLCSGAGFAAYRMTLGRLIMFLSEKIVNALKAAVCFAARCVYIPVKFAACRIMYAFCALYKHTLGPVVAKIILRRDRAKAMRIIREKLPESIKL